MMNMMKLMINDDQDDDAAADDDDDHHHHHHDDHDDRDDADADDDDDDDGDWRVWREGEDITSETSSKKVHSYSQTPHDVCSASWHLGFSWTVLPTSVGLKDLIDFLTYFMWWTLSMAIEKVWESGPDSHWVLRARFLSDEKIETKCQIPNTWHANRNHPISIWITQITYPRWLDSQQLRGTVRDSNWASASASHNGEVER